jgi:hypothetical protein
VFVCFAFVSVPVLSSSPFGFVNSHSSSFSGEEDLENWRIIKEDEIERSESAENAKKLNAGIRAKKPERFSKQKQSKEITDDEWEEMKDVFGS